MPTGVFWMHWASLLSLFAFLKWDHNICASRLLYVPEHASLGLFSLTANSQWNSLHMSLSYLKDFLWHIQSFFGLSGPSMEICSTFCLRIHIMQELKWPAGKVTCFSDCRFFKIKAQVGNAHWVAPDTAPCPTSTCSVLAQLCRSPCQGWRSARVTGQSLGS